ncbi:MAG: helix-hairpin-helix domain-containing protein [Streptococcaceae bacterium]|jgi:competence protein ComEA|nr:helix-hairpin-helix domain-containing protein [Streptococcaceae bacterium]
MLEKIKLVWKNRTLASKIHLFIALGGVLIGVYFVVALRTPPHNAVSSDKLMLTSSSSSHASVSSSKKSTSAASDKITVDVEGAVVKPGVYTISADKRVVDVIALAGGLSASADAHSINQAAKLKDEDVIFVAKVGETAPAAGNSAASSNSAASGKAGASGAKVNINTADLTELQTLSGVGAKKAQDIIDYRTKNGAFKTVEDLGNVAGFGDKTLEKLKDSITVD